MAAEQITLAVEIPGITAQRLSVFTTDRNMKDFRQPTAPASLELTIWQGMCMNGQTVGTMMTHPFVLYAVVRGAAVRTIVNPGTATVCRTTVATS